MLKYLKIVFLLAISLFIFTTAFAQNKVAPASEMELANRLFSDGNYKDAYDKYYSSLTVKSELSDKELSSCFTGATTALSLIGRITEFDELAKKTIETYPDYPDLLSAISDVYYYDITHNGSLIENEYQRGQWLGTIVNSTKRDEIIAIQLQMKAIELLKNDEEKAAAYLNLADKFKLLAIEGAWKLQLLTDITELPDYSNGNDYRPYYRSNTFTDITPVDINGNPICYYTPKSLSAAKNDGERYRYCLERAIALSKGDTKYLAYMEWARFLNTHYGLMNENQYQYRYFIQPILPLNKQNKYPADWLNPKTLKDNETITTLATGRVRLSLPDEFNYLHYYKLCEKSKNPDIVRSSREQLGYLYMARQQYKTALSYFKKIKDSNMQDEISGSWIKLDRLYGIAYGEKLTINVNYRNTTEITFTAYELDMEKVIADVKDYIKGNDINNLAYEEYAVDLTTIGNRIIHKNTDKYFKGNPIVFKEKFSPPKDHSDTYKTVIAPITKPGTWYITAQAKNGNKVAILANIADILLLEQKLEDKKVFFYAADPNNGKGIDGVNIELFGYKQPYRKYKTNVEKTLNFAETTDANGAIFVDRENIENYSWLVIARKDDKIAILGYNTYDYYYSKSSDIINENYKCFILTDRPIYRPKDNVSVKFWANNASYTFHDEESALKGSTAYINISDPMGKSVLQKLVELNDMGGAEAELTLGADASLGNYNISVSVLKEHLPLDSDISNIEYSNLVTTCHGGASFRLEEYKKPEYEVSVKTPEDSIKLGDKVNVTVNGMYYFGEPLSGGEVKYKVTRRTGYSYWVPVMPFDWLYGSGYGVIRCTPVFYPNFARWGYPMYRYSGGQPELIDEGIAKLNSSGELNIEIDTSEAKKNNPENSQIYDISVEVSDESNRVIEASGSVFAAATAFNVYAYPDKGYYTAGSIMTGKFKAITSNNKPVQGKGQITVYEITYNNPPDNSNPIEKAIESYIVESDKNGDLTHQFYMGKAGQYRISCIINDWDGNSAEGAYIVNVVGENFKSENYKFDTLELIPDKPTYSVGDTAKVMINTKHKDAVLLLQMRPVGYFYRGKPEIIQATGKSTIIETQVTEADMPNFLINVTTIVNGRVERKTVNMLVPPVEKGLDIKIATDKEIYEPGETAQVNIEVTDANGLPVNGELALTMYDRSIEYISGGSNVRSIKSYFWSFQRDFYYHSYSSLSNSASGNLTIGEKYMRELSSFLSNIQGVKYPYRPSENMAIAGMGRSSGPSPIFLSDGVDDDKLTLSAASDGGIAFFDNKAAGSDSNVELRTDFNDAAYFNGQIKLDSNGKAAIEIKMPSNLTSWKISGWVMGAGTSVGETNIAVNTKKSIMVRPDTPRFLVNGDLVTLSAMVDNYTDEDRDITATLSLYGVELKTIDKTVPEIQNITVGNESVSAAVSAKTVRVAANSTEKVDWLVLVNGTGTLNLRYTAVTTGYDDGTVISLPVKIYGSIVTDIFSSQITKEEQRTEFEIKVPEERDPDLSTFELRYSPTLALAVMDSLPYIAEYSYEHSDAIAHRVMAASLTKKTISVLGFTLEELKTQTANLNSQQIGNDRERIEQWKKRTFDTTKERSPLYDETVLNKNLNSDLAKIQGMQNPDGGFGWFKYDNSSTYLTANILRSLKYAERSGVTLVPGITDGAKRYLTAYQNEQLRRFKLQPKATYYREHANSFDALIYLTLVENEIYSDEMKEKLYADRLLLPVYALSLYGIALAEEGKDNDKLSMVVSNIDQFMVTDNENQTAYLNLGTNNCWWAWYGNTIEANANYLRLLSRVDPNGEKARGLVKYLLNHRKNGYYWYNISDTSNVVIAFTDYLEATGEMNPDMTVNIILDGREMKKVKITRDNIFTYDNVLFLTADQITSGTHKVEIIKEGRGPLYINAYQTNFSMEKPIEPRGLEVKVQRSYYLLIEEQKDTAYRNSRGNAYSGQTIQYKRTPLTEGDTVKPKDLIEVELTVTSKNEYDYLRLDDFRPAGMENAELLSGYIRGAYMEMRDDRNIMFVNYLRQGTTVYSYKMRAVNRGTFSALPATINGVYAPELTANSRSMIWNIF